MEVEKDVSVTREKKESRLIEEYEEGLREFERRDFDSGVLKLRKLLQNKMIRDNDFRDLRHACFISLGEVYEKELHLMNESIHYLYKAITLKENDFKTWFKLGRICRYQGYFAQAEKCLLMAQKYMPGTSYQAILYQNLTHISFLQENYQVFLQRADYLIVNSFNRTHNLALKDHILPLLGIKKGENSDNGKELHQTLQTSGINQEVEELLAERRAIKLRQAQNAVFARLPVQISKQKEFTIYIDKLTWQNFLKIINLVSKMFFCARRGDPTFKKDKKINTIYTLIKQNHSILNSLIWIKERREAPANETESWNLSKKIEKNSQLSINNTTITTQLLTNSQQKDPNANQNSNSIGSGKPLKKDPKIAAKSIQNGTKKSSRIQENQLNQAVTNLSVEQHVKEFAKKNKFDLKQKLQAFLQDFYQNLPRLKSEETTAKFNQFFNKFTQDSSSGTDSKDKRMSMEDEAAINSNLDEVDHNSQNSLIQKNAQPIVPQIQNAELFCNDDFMAFFTRTKHRAFVNLVDLIEHVLKHFIRNDSRVTDLQSAKIHLGQDYNVPELLSRPTASDTFQYCPNLLLNNWENSNRNIKSEVVKLLTRSYSNFKLNLFERQKNEELTAFELILEEYQRLRQDCLDKPAVAKRRKEKLSQLRDSLKKISFEFFCDYEILTPSQRARIYHSLAIFYTEQDFEYIDLAKAFQAKLVTMFPNEFPEPSAVVTPIKKVILNFFWLERKSLSTTFTEYIQDRIIENKFKKEVIAKPSSQKETATTISEEQSDSLKEHLEEFLKIFESRLLERNGIDDGCELYCRNIFEILSNPHLSMRVFLEKITALLSIFFNMHDHHIMEFKKNLPVLERLFKFESICDLFIKRFPTNNAHEVASVLSINSLKHLLNANLYLLQALVLRVFASPSAQQECVPHKKLIAAFVLTGFTLNTEASQTVRCGVSSLTFLSHDLILMLPATTHQEIYRSWHEFSYFTALFGNIFSFLKEKEQQSIAKKQQQENEAIRPRNSTLQETEESKKDGGKMSIENLSETSADNLSEDDDDESEDGDNRDDINDEKYIFDMIKSIYRSFYGIKLRTPGRKSSNATRSANLNETGTYVFNSMEEIRLFVIFTKRTFPEYLNRLMSLLSTQYIQLLMGCFDYIKKHEDQWALCPNLSIRKDQFSQHIKEKKISDSLILQYLNQRSASLSQTCFCNLSKCFDPLLENDFLNDLLLLIGRALSQYDPILETLTENTQPRFKSRRQSLKNAEKMFNLVILLKPSDFMGWYCLGDVFSGLSFMYFDASVFDPMSAKVTELKDIYLSAKRVYHYLLDRFAEILPIRYVEEVREDILILNIVKLFERKSLYLLARSPSAPQYEFSEISGNLLQRRSRVAAIIEKIHMTDYHLYSPRMIILMEVFVTRANYSKFHSATFHTHFSNLKLIQTLNRPEDEEASKTTAVSSQNKPKQLTDKQQNSLSASTSLKETAFKGEFYELEGQCEFAISVWKIFKRYLQLLKIINTIPGEKKDKISEETARILKEEICKQQPVVSLREILPMVLDDIEETIKSLNKIDSGLLSPIEEGKDIMAVSEMFKREQLLTLNQIGKIGMITCSILSKRISLDDDVTSPDASSALTLRLEGIVSQIQIILTNNCSRFFGLTVKQSQRRLKYKRFFVRSFFYSAQMYMEINQDYNKATTILGDIFNLKLDEILHYYTHFENQCIEKDPKLAVLFTKDLCFMLEKYKYIKMMSTLFKKLKDVERLRALHKKTQKAMILAFSTDPDRINKIFKSLFLQTLNDLLELFEEKAAATQTNENHDNLKKWILDLYQTDIKAKSTLKQIEADNFVINKFKVVFSKCCGLFTPFPEEDSLEDKYAKSIKFLEDQLRKKKVPTKPNPTQKDSQQNQESGAPSNPVEKNAFPNEDVLINIDDDDHQAEKPLAPVEETLKVMEVEAE